jgi:AraC-like DNA-binding protein
MNVKTIQPDTALSLFVKSILVFENDEPQEKSVLPFYADGYPGLVFHQSENGMRVLPQDKQMPPFFLFGMTLHPLELQLEGKFRFIVFQLYPFVLKSFFGVNPTELNDDCYDLSRLEEFDPAAVIRRLGESQEPDHWQELITSLLLEITAAKQEKADPKVREAIRLIIHYNGQRPVSAIREELEMTERTFERTFTAQTGVSPKQFSRIIQFSLSLEDVKRNNYDRLTDIVYKNGFADQSHFIRVFKTFTGKTPSKFI